jgi:hypothetical protein
LLPPLFNCQHGGIDGGQSYVTTSAPVAAEASAVSRCKECLATILGFADLLDGARTWHNSGGAERELALLARTPARSELALAILSTKCGECRRRELTVAHLAGAHWKRRGFDPEIFGI